MLSMPPGDNDDKRQGSCPQELRVPLPTLLVYFTEKVTEKVGMGFGAHVAPVPPPFCVCALVSASVLSLRVSLPSLAKVSPPPAQAIHALPAARGHCSSVSLLLVPPVFPFSTPKCCHFSRLNIPSLYPTSFPPGWPQCSPYH